MTYEMTRLEELQQIYSDMYKDVHGFRPRHMSDEFWNSEAAIEAELDNLDRELKVVVAEEKAMQAEAAVRFEARVTETIKLGARDRATAIRWIADAEDVNGDLEYLCYKMHLRYGYFKQAA